MSRKNWRMESSVALSGRVYCLVDASRGAIEPGGTSNLPGYAMKAADPAKAQGAIIGKAMTPLSKGKGLVPGFGQLAISEGNHGGTMMRLVYTLQHLLFS
ncbi:MAG: hypothetical protein U0X75_03170 [Acidobacteriota bacterium]